MQRKVSAFWLSGAKRQDTKAWAERDAQLRAEHYRGHHPSEYISYAAWKRLPAKRRQAIEAAAYQRGM